ncbi:hypothetical protein DRQ20_01360 [bacterium]|nr:MAG: hypothetical protein DRQ18_00215 [bacterium]RKZ27087.1 MAG: hypothetical protein DRQ20_01360 [bacterium]
MTGLREKFERIKAKKDKKEIEEFLSELRKAKEEIERLEREATQLLGGGEVARFAHLMRSTPVNILTLKDRGWNLIVNEEYEEAIKVLRKASKLAPQDVDILILLGWAYTNAKRYDEAMAVYQRILKMDPNNEMARVNLGYISYQLGIFGEAIERFSRIINTGKDKKAKLYACYYMGRVYLDREMYRDAVEFFERAIEMGPNLYEAYYFLGIAYRRMGKEEKAKEVWNELIKRNPYNKWAEAAKEAMK